MKSLELNGLLELNGVKRSFVARISEPQAGAEGTDYFCSVHAPALFKQDKEIFGIDAEQAKELAVQFLKSLLEGKQLTDKAGKNIDLKNWP